MLERVEIQTVFRRSREVETDLWGKAGAGGRFVEEAGAGGRSVIRLGRR